MFHLGLSNQPDEIHRTCDLESWFSITRAGLESMSSEFIFLNCHSGEVVLGFSHRQQQLGSLREMPGFPTGTREIAPSGWLSGSKPSVSEAIGWIRHPLPPSEVERSPSPHRPDCGTDL